ncbi:MAG: hypothetical protein H6573_02860 [Lewinellaceae bacterium]|nr:hypothetical protein [Lewinellaceae bacterium]
MMDGWVPGKATVSAKRKQAAVVINGFILCGFGGKVLNSMFKIHLLKTKVELENPNMAVDYGEVHGKGSWQLFPGRTGGKCVEGATMNCGTGSKQRVPM